MDELELKVNSLEVIVKDKKFVRFFEEFYREKMKKFMRNVMRMHYNCVYECISEDSVNKVCVQECEEVIADSWTRVNKEMQSKLALFPLCLKECQQNNKFTDCLSPCKSSTLEILKKFDPMVFLIKSPSQT